MYVELDEGEKVGNDHLGVNRVIEHPRRLVEKLNLIYS